MASSSDFKLEIPKKEIRNWYPSYRKRTLWSYYFEGNVEIPEICIDSLFLSCPDERNACSRLHAKKRWHWQFVHNNEWHNFLEFQSDTLERSFQIVDKDEVVLPYLDPLKTGRHRQEVMKVLGNDSWRADFDQMKIYRIDGLGAFNIRRLSTPSSGKVKDKYASEFRWYMLHEGSWVEFGPWVEANNESSGGWSHSGSSTTSIDIEKQFQKNDSRLMTVNVSVQKAKIDFVNMVLIYKKSKKKVPVRRRPKNDDIVYPPMWSHYTQGNVEIPEMCINTIGEQCKVKNGCGCLHGNSNWQWQFMQNGIWYNFPKRQRDTFEKAFLDVWEDSVEMPAINPPRLGHEYGVILKELLGTTKWWAQFECMTIMKISDSDTVLKIRRLTTPSTFRSNNESATEFVWFFKNDNDFWVEFGCDENQGISTSVSPLTTSYDIEKCYESRKWDTMEVQISSGSYELSFSSMVLKNSTTEEKFKVRRRPECARSDKIHLRSKKRIVLPNVSREYEEARAYLLLSLNMPEIISITRVQDPYNWTNFKKRQEDLASNHGTDAVLNIHTLFHWVEVQVMDDIYENHFNWRHQCEEMKALCGNKGVVFFRSAEFLHNSCASPSIRDHRLLVFKVLVGRRKASESDSASRSNSQVAECTSEVDNEFIPNRFIKYDKRDYCLQYVMQLGSNGS